MVKEKIDQLTSIPGVGITLATKAYCELPELGNIDFSFDSCYVFSRLREKNKKYLPINL